MIPNWINIKIFFLTIAMCTICISAYSQLNKDNLNDTLIFDGFNGINFAKGYLPNFNREELKDRFKPDYSIVKLVEQAIRKQYVNAFKKYLYLEYKGHKQSREDLNRRTLRKNYLERKKTLIPLQEKRILEEYALYDRQYFGFISPKGIRYVMIEFEPHNPKYFEEGGESHVRKFPLLVFNTESNVLSLAGWTGSVEDI